MGRAVKTDHLVSIAKPGVDCALVLDEDKLFSAEKLEAAFKGSGDPSWAQGTPSACYLAKAPTGNSQTNFLKY